MDQSRIKITSSAAKALIKRTAADLSIQQFREKCDMRGHYGEATGGKPLEKPTNITREEETLLHQLRLNRAPFLQQTRYKWGRSDSPECPRCPGSREQEDTRHFLRICPGLERKRRRTLGFYQDLGILQNNITAVINFVRESGVLN